MFTHIQDAKLQPYFSVVASNSGDILTTTLTLKEHLDFSGFAASAPEFTLPGDHYFICFNNQYNNYYHFLLEWVGSICLYKQLIASEAIPSTTALLLPPLERCGFLKESLELVVHILGCTNKLLYISEGYNVIGVRNLYVPNLLYGHSAFTLADFDLHWYKDLIDMLSSSTSEVYKRSESEYMESPLIVENKSIIGLRYIEPPRDKIVYVSRFDSENRRIVNEERLALDLHRNLGATIVSMRGKTLAYQSSLFNNARIIISPHGAALSNLVFCDKQITKSVIELQPSNYKNMCFKTISARLGIDHLLIDLQCLNKSDVSNGIHQHKSHLAADVCSILKVVDQVIDSNL